jgi:hypothetical protein
MPAIFTQERMAMPQQQIATSEQSRPSSLSPSYKVNRHAGVFGVYTAFQIVLNVSFVIAHLQTFKERQVGRHIDGCSVCCHEGAAEMQPLMEHADWRLSSGETDNALRGEQPGLNGGLEDSSHDRTR